MSIKNPVFVVMFYPNLNIYWNKVIDKIIAVTSNIMLTAYPLLQSLNKIHIFDNTFCGIILSIVNERNISILLFIDASKNSG